MKKLVLALGITTALTASAFAQTAQNQSNGQIEFSGEVTNASCTLNPIKPVNLGSVSKNSLKTAGAGAGWGTSTIQFVDCELGTEDNNDVITSVTLDIQPGTAAANNSELWENTALDGADNVGISVKIDNKNISPTGGELVTKNILKDGTLSLNVAGRIVATGEATPGKVESTVNFVAKYK